MEFWRTALATHGYSILVIAVFLDAIGLPIPAALALLVAGGAAAQGYLYVPSAFGGALAAMLFGDTLLFLLGRYTGWWLLGILCRLSLNPEACIFRSADSFYRRGKTLLVFSKFIPGINSIAPPLAGSMNMRLGPFLGFDFAGAVLYVGSFFGVGYAFSGALGPVMRDYQAAGRIVAGLLIALVVGYLGFQIWLWLRARTLSAVRFASPHEAARELATGACIFDVRSHGYFDAKAVRIRGSRRLDPNALHQTNEQFPTDREIFLYCTCLREATSVRVARELQGRGLRVAVIKGGLRAWKATGLPLEPVPADEVSALPVFD